LRRTDELIAFITNYLFEGERIFLSERIVSLLREEIDMEKDECRLRIEPVVFLIKVLAATSDNDDENDALYEKCFAETQYHIKRIIYRKNHEHFDADDFLRNSLPFDLLEHLDGLERKIPDITLFKNLLEMVVCKLDRDPMTVMSVSLQLARMAECPSFLSRVANSQDNDCKRIQQKILGDLYSRAIGETLPEIFEFDIFLEFCIILEDAEILFFDNSVYLKVITEKCTRFLNSLRNIHTLNLTHDELMFYYDCAMNTAWFLILHYTHWKGVKLLLNAFRSSKEILVKRNLSPNSEFGWKNLTLSIEKLFMTGKEDELRRLRQDMANGLADLLKPIPENKQNPRRENNYSDDEKSLHGFDITLFEPNPDFRYAYVKAIGDLGVDPDGNGHFIHTILDKTAENDPDPKIRKAAETVSQELKNLNGGWKKGNHTRFLNEAYWWIRRAHLLTLGKEKEFDEKAANEYRVQENRRYK
jgi:hypothetical protein